MTETITLHLNDTCVFNLKPSGIACLNLSDFNKCYKNVIEPAAETETMKRILIDYIKKYPGIVGSAEKKINILTGAKSEKTIEYKIIVSMMKMKTFIIQKYESDYYLCDAFRVLKCTREALENVGKTNANIRIMLNYCDRFNSAEMSGNDIYETRREIKKLYERFISDLHYHGMQQIDFSKSIVQKKQHKTDINKIRSFTNSENSFSITIDNDFIKMLKCKKFNAYQQNKPIFTADEKYMILPIYEK